MEISSTSKMLTGVILLTIPTIEYGGAFLLGMLRSSATGYVDNALRHDLFRAGHAHAGVMVLLSLICQFLADAAFLPGWLIWIGRAKTRPVVIVSRYAPESPRALVLWLPLTTRNRHRSYEVPLPRLSFLDRDSVANVQGMGHCLW